MPKHVIEQTVPGAGQVDAQSLAAITRKSNAVRRDAGHAHRDGFPVEPIVQIHAVIDPLIAEMVA